MDTRGVHAFVRFGLGRRGQEAVPADPADWLLSQLRKPDPAPVDPTATTAEGLAAIREDRRTRPPPGESRARALFRTQGQPRSSTP